MILDQVNKRDRSRVVGSQEILLPRSVVCATSREKESGF